MNAYLEVVKFSVADVVATSVTCDGYNPDCPNDLGLD